MATRVHEVKFPGDGFWTVLTNYVQAKSMQLDELLMNSEYRACKDVYRFTIAGYTAAIHDDFYNATSEILFRCTESGTTLFTGKIDPNYRQRIGQLLGPLVLEAEDNSYLLDETVQTSFAYPTLVGGAALKIFDSGDTANSIIHKLLTAAGYNIATDIAGAPDIPDDITTTITHVSGSKDEGTYWELIDDILHFHGYVMRWSADGKYTHENWAPSVVTSTHTFKDDLATNPALVTEKKFVDFDGVECEWCTLATRSNARLFQMNTPFNSDGTFAGESIAAGSEYPLGADTDDTYQDYREKWLDLPPRPSTYSGNVFGRGRRFAKPGIKAIDLIASSGHSIKDSYENGITRTLSYESLRAKLYYSNPTGSTLKLWYSYIYGDALFRAMIKTTKSLFVAGATRLAQIQTRHLYNETVATKYAIARRNALQYGDFTYSFASKTSVGVGSIATIQYTDPVTSIAFDTEVVVVGKKKSKHLPLYHYTAFGVSAYSVESVDTEGVETTNLVYEGIRDSARGTNLLPDASTFTDYDPIPQTDCEYWDLRQPDCKSSEDRSPESGYLTSFFPGHLYDELKTEYDNLWGKFAGLGTIGVYKAAENLVTDPEDLTTSNWTRSSTNVLQDTYWQNRRFTRCTSDGGSASRCTYQSVGIISSTTASIQVVMKKVDSQKSAFGLYKTTAAAGYVMRVMVVWSTKAISIVNGTGTIVSAKWYASDTIVEILVAITGMTSGHSYTAYLFPTYDVAEAKSAEFTAVQVEDSAYPTPYTPTERAAGALDFSESLPNQGTIECWVRPWFIVSDTAHRVFCWGIDSTHRLQLYFANTTNTWRVYWINGGTGRYLDGTTVFTNTTLWAWIHLKITWNISAGTGSLIVNGSTEDSSWSGALDAFTTPIETLSIGLGGYDDSQHFDGLITDFLFKSYVDTSTAHYTADEPYYDPDETANQYQSVRINRMGIRLFNNSLTIQDSRNRQILISNADGLLVRDAGGQIIHDIPTAPVLIGAYPMGHLYELKYNNTAYTILSSSAFSNNAWNTGQQALALENQRIGGVRLKIYLFGSDVGLGTTVSLEVSLRPQGSSWGSGATNMSPSLRRTLLLSSSIISQATMVGVLDVPVNPANNQFDAFLLAIPNATTRTVLIQQLGVWV